MRNRVNVNTTETTNTQEARTRLFHQLGYFINKLNNIYMVILTLCMLMNSSICFDKMSLGCVHINPNKVVLKSLKVVFILTNSGDSDEMLHNAAFQRVTTVCFSTHSGVFYIQRANV